MKALKSNSNKTVAKKAIYDNIKELLFDLQVCMKEQYNNFSFTLTLSLMNLFLFLKLAIF